MGKENPRGNAFPSATDEPANTFTAQSPLKDSIEPTLKFLHGLLWGQEKRLLNTIFSDFQHPSWNRDTNPHINSDDTRTAVKLTLRRIASTAEFLPCGESELLVRNAYREMYDILLEAQELRMKYLNKDEPIPRCDRIILILGQPGIGKTWFLSYVLVRRLLEGKRTIFQEGENPSGDSMFTTAAHYLINGNGVSKMDKEQIDSALDKAEIWVLADQNPFGVPQKAKYHKWLVVVTSSPQKDNYKQIVRDYSPRKFYFPTWDWDEVVAAAYVLPPHLRTSYVLAVAPTCSIYILTIKLGLSRVSRRRCGIRCSPSSTFTVQFRACFSRLSSHPRITAREW